MAFLYSNWLSLDLPTRVKLAYKLGIPKTGPTHVFDNRIQSDGYDVRHIEKALDVTALQELLKTKETDPTVLWKMIVESIEEPPAFDGVTEMPPEMPAITKPLEVKPRGRPRKVPLM